MVRRSFDAKAFNALINHPAVYPWVAREGSGELDASAVVENSANYLLVNEHGGCLFVPTQAGEYEVHTQILPEGRHRSLQTALAAVRFMFEQTDCQAITTYVPEGNAGALRLTLAVGFEGTGREGSWTYPDGRCVPLDWFILTKDRWLKCRLPQS